MIAPTTRIVITPRQRSQMENDVSSRAPEEACGLLAGVGNITRMVIPVTNSLHDSHRFRLDTQEQLAALLLAEEKGWDILAIYHSHPDGLGFPSPTDLAELTFPGVIYLIWYKEAKSWRCRGFLMRSSSDNSEVDVIISTKL